MKNETYEKGMKLFKELHGEHAGETIVEGLRDICPDFATYTIEFAFGTLLQRKGLDLKTRELAIIASCVTLGNAIPQLIAHVEAALKTGATKQEINEVILQTALYAGFPAVTNAFHAIKETLNKSH
jgi:4-carboxymuconolactone decarboxylase